MKSLLTLVLFLVFSGTVFAPSVGYSQDESAYSGLPAPWVEVGKVVFLLGQAEIKLSDGSLVPVVKGMPVVEGSRILVKDRSQVGLRMVDGGVEQIRANSIFVIHKYLFDADNPAASQIRFELISGEVSSKTGLGGQAAKQRYRLNTPLAAIGVRGTEFTVSTNDAWTHVSLNSGEIVMSSFNDSSCLRSGSGPCLGVGAETLSEAQRGLGLILRAGQFKPELVPLHRIRRLQNAAAKGEALSGLQEEASQEASDEEKTNNVADSGIVEEEDDSNKASQQENVTATTEESDGSQQSADTGKAEVSADGVAVVAAAENGGGKQSGVSADGAAIVVTAGSGDAKHLAVDVVSESAAGAIADNDDARMEPVLTVDAADSVIVMPDLSGAQQEAGEVYVIPPVVAAPVDVSTPDSSLQNPVVTSREAAPVAVAAAGSTDVVSASDAPIISEPVIAPGGALTPVAGPVESAAPLVASVAPLSDSVRWGRFNPSLGTDGVISLGELVDEEYELIMKNRDYAIARLNDYAVQIPETGEYHFTPVNYEAYLRDLNSNGYFPATVSDGELKINFATQQFATEFMLEAEGFADKISATGRVSENGIFEDNRANYTRIEGAVGGDNGVVDSAAYGFYHYIDPGRSATGAIGWVGGAAD